MGYRMDIVLAGMETALILLYVSIRVLGDQVRFQWTVIFWKESFF